MASAIPFALQALLHSQAHPSASFAGAVGFVPGGYHLNSDDWMSSRDKDVSDDIFFPICKIQRQRKTRMNTLIGKGTNWRFFYFSWVIFVAIVRTISWKILGFVDMFFLPRFPEISRHTGNVRDCGYGFGGWWNMIVLPRGFSFA